MSVRRGPTERRRSEGIPTKEEPNQEQAPLVTWGAFPSNSPKAKRSAPRQALLILILMSAESDPAKPVVPLILPIPPRILITHHNLNNMLGILEPQLRR